MTSIEMNRPDLSIVIVSFNTREMTRECLASVYENIGELTAQVIVVDNASADGSVEMIRASFPQALLIANDCNAGFAKANNQGFRLATGRFVLLLNSDTIVLGDVLRQSVSYLEANPAVGAMGCRVLNRDRTMQATCSGFPTLGRLIFMTSGLDRLPAMKRFDHYLLRGWQRDTERDVEVISGCYLLVREEVIRQVGVLDEDFFFFGEETDWCLRMRKAGWQLKFAPVGEIIHYGGGSVKKLNYRRDVMLTEATIRLHRKHGGWAAAAAAFGILAIFNVSRAAIWSLVSLLRRDCRTRAAHFLHVSAHTFQAWPRGRN